MQSKIDYKTHTKNVDLEPFKNTQHSLTTPQFPKTLFETDLHTITIFKEGNRIHLHYKGVVQMNRKAISYLMRPNERGCLAMMKTKPKP